jgi:hypothetical protein
MIIDKGTFFFKKYAEFDVTSLSERVSAFTEEEWNSFTFRQETYDVHSQTLTVPLRYNKPDVEGVIQTVTTELFKDYEDDIFAIENAILDATGQDFKILNCNFVNLPSGHHVLPHRDTGSEFTVKRRMHLPILTNDHVVFTVDQEAINMKAGEIWEVNNSTYVHSVDNNGTTDRVHFLFDMVLR